jgi:hypothetical protein
MPNDTGVKLEYADFGGASNLIAADLTEQWSDVETILGAMPLHLKASDQANIRGTPIFDAVGTNAFIRRSLVDRGWEPGLAIPSDFRFLGAGVDFWKKGVIAEVQFSNYPFLLSNVVRADLLYKLEVSLADDPTSLLLIVTKARMFPASQSTLYFEQAVEQLQALAAKDVFAIPMRVVGLFEDSPSTIEILWTEYHEPRYSRTVVTQHVRHCAIGAGATERSRTVLELLD